MDRGLAKLRRSVIVALLSIAGAAGGWFGSDALEARNDFCNACHLPNGDVLHGEIRAGFDAAPPRTLSGLHQAAGVLLGSGTESREFRCIDCHGGVGFVGRAKVKALAAKDALVWLGGDFDEPDHMQYPLGEEDCRQCHEGFRPAVDEQDAALRFHALAVHNADLGFACVECHTAHDGGDDAAMFFMNPQGVREQCARCHSEFQEGMQ